MYLPEITNNTTKKETIEVFYGYDARPEVGDGYFNETKNLSADYYPMLSPRKRRSTVMPMTKPQGMIEKDALAYIDNGTLYYDFQETPIAPPAYMLTDGEKQLVSMGAYICIFPDGIFYNTQDSTDYGYMAASTTIETVKYEMCHQDGTLYESVSVGTEQPTDTSVDIWVSTGNGSTVYYTYSAASATWVELNTVYAKITFASLGTIPAMFSEYDAVTISGSSYDDVNGSKVIYACGGSSSENDYIVVVYPMTAQSMEITDTLSISRTVPDMDYVCEAQNRLWGCKYGIVNGETINEIYCCALGDFKNWNQFLGISTDSWVGSVGSDGQWTGCINYLGTPTFFKENHIHEVSISSSGAHQLTETPCRGVQKGSSRSLRVVNETLFYKSRTDVCSFKGSFPTGVSNALGDGFYTEAIAGSFGDKYYISMKDSGGDHQLFSYDTSRGIWEHEDGTAITCFASVDSHLYATTDSEMIDLNGESGDIEKSLEWEAVSGIMQYDLPENKYVTRFDIRAIGSEGSTLQVLMEYDSSGKWIDHGTMSMEKTGTVVWPIRPHRCDHLRIKLVGSGEVKIFSIVRLREQGSDV